MELIDENFFHLVGTFERGICREAIHLGVWICDLILVHSVAFFCLLTELNQYSSRLLGIVLQYHIHVFDDAWTFVTVRNKMIWTVQLKQRRCIGIL